MNELVEFYLGTLRSFLIGEGVPREIAEAVVSLCRAGNLDSGVLLETAYQELFGGLSAPRRSLVAMVEMLAQYTPRLDRNEISRTDLQASAATLSELASIAEELESPAMAYNFLESCCHLSDVADQPALAVTRRLRRLANPDNVPQFYGAIWRLAAEELRDALDRGSGWLAALDAVELALTLHVPHPALQQQLFDKLHTQVCRAQHTPIGELVLQVIFEAPPGTGLDAVRPRALAALIEGETGPIPPGTPPAIIEGAAALRVQTAIGDLRLQFLPQTEQGPEIDMIDLRYRDSRLSNAVPIGRSLIIDPKRTDTLLLDMAHEVGHAVVLQGAIGSRQSLYRAVATFCEFMLVGQLPREPADWPLDRLQALHALPDTQDAFPLADLQLGAVEKGAVERAVWRSWLEGVSLYIELLCDPKDDPNEISIVHECVRGLIDFTIDRRPDEDDAAYQERYAGEIVAQFDDFMSAAIKKRSRANHLDYAHNLAAGAAARDIYVLGYLLVRSVVAAWEATLGRRLPPAIAVKLLLNATQVGTHDALPDPRGSRQDHWHDAQQLYLAWVVDLTTLERSTLEDFFTPVETGQRGLPTIWEDGRPRRVPVVDEAIRAAEKDASDAVHRHALILAGLDPDRPPPPEANLHKLVATFLGQQFEWNGLLPIGADRPRLMFLRHDDRVCLAIRTYGGNEAMKAQHLAAGNATQAYDARYHLRLMALEGGKTERESIRAAFADAGTGRAYATRIIDLRGHALAPLDVRGASFICVFLPTGYEFVMQGQTRKPITRSHPKFVALLKRRMFPPFAFMSEGDTIASLEFLSRRAERAACDPPIHETHSETSLVDLAHHCALAAAGVAFGTKEFSDAYKVAMADTAFRSALANILHASGRGLALVDDSALNQPSMQGHALARMIFDPAAPSTVKPFGAMP